MFYITVVLYNKELNDIASKESLIRFVEEKGHQKVEILVVDNSNPAFYKNHMDTHSDFVSIEGIAYIRNNDNCGLSKAYNLAIQHAIVADKDLSKDFMMFLDDDTPIPYEYLDGVYNAYEKIIEEGSDINVITGLISSAGLPMSPMKKYKLKFNDCDYIKEPGVYEDIICINSGMAVRVSCLEKTEGFSEELFLDMMDFLLLYNLSMHSLCKVQVLGLTFEQDFSGRRGDDKDSLIRRFDIYKKDFSKYCELTKRGSLFRNVGIIKRRIAIEHKARR